MTGSARRLGDWPSAWVEVACRRCDRRGRYRRETLLAQHGPEALMPDLRHEIAADCPLQATLGTTRCGVYYANAPGLAELRAEAARKPDAF